MRKLLSIIALLITVAINAQGQTAEQWFKQGVIYDDQKNYSQAFQCYLKAANMGLKEAQTCLGECYYAGEGVAQNYAEAVKWYRKAAEQGDFCAQYDLGNCYYNGKGVSQNYAEAVKWYRKAAEQGEDNAQYNLGNCYYNGEGVAKNYAEAVKWFRKAAEQGDAYAQYNLGNCYYNGEGVVKNYAEAVKWFRKVAEQGDADAQFRLGVCYYNGEGVAKNYTEAVKWYRKAAEQGYADAQYYLGNCYYKGNGIDKNFAEATKWFKLVINNKDSKEEFKNRASLSLSIISNSSKSNNTSSNNQQPQNKPTQQTTPSQTTTTTQPTQPQQTTPTQTTTKPTQTTTTYTPSTYTYTKSYKFNENKNKYQWVGFTFGYVQKYWEYSDDEGNVEQHGPFDNKDFTHGVTGGFTFDPQFGAGFGMHTGIFYEYYFATSDDYVDDNGYLDKIRYNEHTISIPLHLKFNMNFSRSFQLAVFGGAAADGIVSGNFNFLDADSNEKFYTLDVCDEDLDQKRFNFSWEIGGSLRIRNWMFDFTTSHGFFNQSRHKSDYNVMQIKPMRITATIFF